MKSFALWMKDACEYVGGVLDAPPAGLRLPTHSPLWGVWWAVLACLILLFCGQSSKFIYIDF